MSPSHRDHVRSPIRLSTRPDRRASLSPHDRGTRGDAERVAGVSAAETPARDRSRLGARRQRVEAETPSAVLCFRSLIPEAVLANLAWVDRGSEALRWLPTEWSCPCHLPRAARGRAM